MAETSAEPSVLTPFWKGGAECLVRLNMTSKLVNLEFAPCIFANFGPTLRIHSSFFPFNLLDSSKLMKLCTSRRSLAYTQWGSQFGVCECYSVGFCFLLAVVVFWFWFSFFDFFLFLACRIYVCFLCSLEVPAVVYISAYWHLLIHINIYNMHIFIVYWDILKCINVYTLFYII